MALPRFEILVLNAISPRGLQRLPPSRYAIGTRATRPDAILLRSADLHAADLPDSLRAVARAGAGTNNIPVERLSRRGVPVFNAPGGNANAVKELVLAGLLMAARRLAPALRFVDGLSAPADADPAAIDRRVEAGKQAFAGRELAGHTLGIVGLGKVGCLVADAAIRLGMDVLGFDPHITVDAAWSLPSQVRRASSVAEVLKRSDFVTLHVPLLGATRHLVNADNVGLLRADAVLLNFSRDAVADEAAVLAAIAGQRLGGYVCDFPSAALNAAAAAGQPVLALPHLGASTAEAEDNCAVMVADQLRDFLEHGNVLNAVNFPNVAMVRESNWRVAIANANVPNMLGQISTAMARAGLNIHNMVNKSRGEMAYTLVDVDSEPGDAVLDDIRAVEGVLMVRDLPQPG